MTDWDVGSINESVFKGSLVKRRLQKTSQLGLSRPFHNVYHVLQMLSGEKDSGRKPSGQTSPWCLVTHNSSGGCLAHVIIH